MPTRYTTSASSTSDSTVWNTWTSLDSGTSCASYIASTTWTVWNEEGATPIHYTDGGRYIPQNPYRDEDSNRPSTRLEEASLEVDAASKRAKALLEENLSPEQKEQLRHYGSFLVRGQSGKMYEIQPRISGNIVELDENGRYVRRYCAHPHNAHEIPLQDTFLAQKLHLEANEEAFLGIANQQPVFGSGGRSPHYARA